MHLFLKGHSLFYLFRALCEKQVWSCSINASYLNINLIFAYSSQEDSYGVWEDHCRDDRWVLIAKYDFIFSWGFLIYVFRFYLSVLFFCYNAINEQAQPFPCHATQTHICNTFLLISHLICRQIFRASGPKHWSVISTNLHVSLYISLDSENLNMFLLKHVPYQASPTDKLIKFLCLFSIYVHVNTVGCVRSFLHIQTVILGVWFNLDMLFSVCTKKKIFSLPFFILKYHPWYSTWFYFHFIVYLPFTSCYFSLVHFSWPLFWLSSPFLPFFLDAFINFEILPCLRHAFLSHMSHPAGLT